MTLPPDCKSERGTPVRPALQGEADSRADQAGIAGGGEIAVDSHFRVSKKRLRMQLLEVTTEMQHHERIVAQAQAALTGDAARKTRIWWKRPF